jgi:hypothetical protein
MVTKEIGKLATLMLVLSALVVTTATKALAEDAVEPAPKTLLGDYLKEKGISITSSATLDFYDKYVWRGQYLDTDPVVQPGISFSSYGVTVGYWGSLPMGSTSDTLNSQESDFYLSYAYTFDPVTLSAGHTWYEFPGGSTSSKEFYFSASLATLLTPTFAFYHDYEDGKTLNTDKTGNYYTLSIAHSVPLLPEYNVSLELGATYGYIDGQWLSGTGSHFTPTVGVKLPLTANLSVTPTLGYNWTMGDLEDSNIGNQESKLFGGVKSSMTF